MDKSQNKLAFHNYFIEETIEAGIVLEGWEVKAIREKSFSIKEAYAIIQKNEVFLIGTHISKTSKNLSKNENYDSLRTRKLLLNKKEISHLIGAVKQTGYSLLPLNIYTSGNKIKILLGLGKGKNSRDKREDVKNRDWDREKSRILKNNKK